MLADVTISDIHSLGKPKALEILGQIARVEKKTFPSSEVFPFGEELWRKKPNTRVLYVTWTSQQTQPHSPLIAYAVYARQKGVAWVHKVCVAEAFRGKGVGTRLMDHIRARLQQEGCQYVYLWVDKARAHARSLYLRTGFEEHEELPDYYAPGRNAIKMVLGFERGT
ncbi:acyl-CoA N-acyltransferase [Aspergillus pseudoustus]|uniref:Acyl-CoA N-acyltransferase n=1 Tax=Aspergillus pseudoustus TaxID=1810923 RepID=A0ABR4ISE5_9EURO